MISTFSYSSPPQKKSKKNKSLNNQYNLFKKNKKRQIQPPMGTSTISQNQSTIPKYTNSQKQKLIQQYIYISDKHDTIIGKPRIVKSTLTNIQLQQYYVSNQQNPIQIDINIYKLRSSSYSKNIVVVFHHILLDQFQKLFLIRIEKIKGRLNQIQGLSYLQALCLLQASFNGFAQLIYHTKSPFVITQKMIAINQSSMVRVWLNQNYALNKIMPGIKIRSQNIMIHQIFTAIADHVSSQQLPLFTNIRYKIAQTQRIIDAKMIITMLIQHCNRRTILQQLVQKQITKITKTPPSHKPLPHDNFNTIPRNPHLTPLIINSQLPNNLTPLPLSPINSMITNLSLDLGLDKIHQPNQEYIKDDQGADRIRVIHQQHNHNSNPQHSNNITNPNLPIIYGKPAHNKQVIYDYSQQQQQQQPVIVSARRLHPDQNQSISRNQQKIPTPPTFTQQTPLLRKHQDKTPLLLNDKMSISMAQRSGIRTTSIFGNNKTQTTDQQHLQTNLRKSPINIPPRPVSPFAITPKKLSPNKVISPIKIKPISIDHNYQKSYPSSTLPNKIALSTNKINQIQKKINKLKLQFNKNNQKNKIKYGTPHADQNNNHNTTNINNTQNNHNNNNNNNNNNNININNNTINIKQKVLSPQKTLSQSIKKISITQQMKSLQKYQIQKFKTQNLIGQTITKWDKKIKQLVNNGSHEQSSKNIKQHKLVQDRQRKSRKSQIFIDCQKKNSQLNLRKSMITDLPSTARAQLTPTIPPAPKIFQPRLIKDDMSNKRSTSPFYHHYQPQKPQTSSSSKHPPHQFPNGIYLTNPDKNTSFKSSHPKTQINFNGNILTRTHNPYLNNNNVIQNKSSIITRNHYF